MLNFVVFGFHQWWRRMQKFQAKFSTKFSGEIFNQIFVGLDREAGSSKLARFGIVRGCAARDRSRRLLRLTISSICEQSAIVAGQVPMTKAAACPPLSAHQSTNRHTRTEMSGPSPTSASSGSFALLICCCTPAAHGYASACVPTAPTHTNARTRTRAHARTHTPPLALALGHRRRRQAQSPPSTRHAACRSGPSNRRGAPRAASARNFGSPGTGSPTAWSGCHRGADPPARGLRPASASGGGRVLDMLPTLALGLGAASAREPRRSRG